MRQCLCDRRASYKCRLYLNRRIGFCTLALRGSGRSPDPRRLHTKAKGTAPHPLPWPQYFQLSKSLRRSSGENPGPASTPRTTAESLDPWNPQALSTADFDASERPLDKQLRCAYISCQGTSCQASFGWIGELLRPAAEGY